MAIDFTGDSGFESVGVSLAYLVYGVYHDENGTERAVYWCGPKNRVGSGLIAPVPPNPENRGGGLEVIWESRLNRCSLESDLGPLHQYIQTVTDLNFNVDISGPPNIAPPEPGELLRDIVYGRWENKRVYAWLYDLGTGDTQVIASGFFDRNPTSINPNVFQVTVGVQPFIPTMSWPSLQLPSDAQDVWVVDGSNPHPTDDYKANVTVLNPDHAGKYMGPIFGNSRTAQEASAETLYYNANIPQRGNNWGWREAVPYGWNNAPLGQRWIFALVAIEDEVYVHDVVYEMAGDRTKTAQVLSHAFDTLYNTDPDNGPLGTVVRFKISLTGNPTTGLNPFVWWMGPKNRVFVRVSGRRCGRIGTEVSPGIREYSFQDYPDRSLAWEILEDLVEESIYLKDKLDEVEPGLSNRFWGTTALSDFQAALPDVPNTADWAKLCCAVPLDLQDRPMTLREGLGTLGAAFLFDLVVRRDPIAQEMRLYPIWRSSFITEPERVFQAQDLAKTDPPTITQLNDPDGHYANSIVVSTPPKYGQPLKESANWLENGGDFVIDPTIEKQFTLEDVAEQEATRAGAVVAHEAKPEHWHHHGDSGDATGAWVIANEMSQPQRVVQATHGVLSYSLPMGAAIRYDIPGVNGDVGMVRKMRFDYDLQTVQVTSYHVNHYTSRGAPRGEDPSAQGDTDRSPPSIEEE